MNEQLQNELEEQARLLGMSAERECDLRGKLERERALADRLAEIVEEGIEDLDEDGGDWPQAFAALAAWKEARSE